MGLGVRDDASTRQETVRIWTWLVQSLQCVGELALHTSEVSAWRRNEAVST